MAQVKKIGRSFHTFYFRIEEKKRTLKTKYYWEKKNWELRKNQTIASLLKC